MKFWDVSYYKDQSEPLYCYRSAPDPLTEEQLRRHGVILEILKYFEIWKDDISKVVSL